MKSILIPGTGCCSVSTFGQNVKAAAEEPGILIGLEKVDHPGRILRYRVISLPALLIDGAVKVKGRIADIPEIKKTFKILIQ